jgi:hypothetical protein
MEFIFIKLKAISWGYYCKYIFKLKNLNYTILRTIILHFLVLAIIRLKSLDLCLLEYFVSLH